MKDHTEYIKNQIREFLKKVTDMDASGINLLTSEEHYTRRAVYEAFEWLRDWNHETKDGQNLHHRLHDRLMEYLEDHDRYVLKFRIYFIVLALTTLWIAFRCGARKIRRINRGEWCVTLPSSTWYLYDPYRSDADICLFPQSDKYSAAYWEVGVYGKHFIRDLMLVDSIIPWMREEVRQQKYEMEKKRKIREILKASQTIDTDCQK